MSQQHGDVVAGADGDGRALERVRADGPDVWAQVRYAVEREWAVEPEDVMRRRTTLAIRGEADADVRERIVDVLRA